MKEPYKKYAVNTLIGTGLVLAVAGLFNLLVDPYNYFGLNRMGVFISAEREAKATQVRRYAHEVLLVGNSRAAMIPMAAIPGVRGFNGAFGGGTPQEVCYFIEHFARNQKLVLVSIDFGAYSGLPVEADPFVRWQCGDILDKIISLKTIEYSGKTIGMFLGGKPTHLTEDGTFNAKRWFELYDRDNPSEFQRKVTEQQRVIDSYNRQPGNGLAPYETIMRICRQRSIRCAAFIPPMEEDIARYLRQHPNYGKYLLWKQEITAIFPDIVDLAFSRYSPAENFFKSDPIHFKPQIGVAILSREVLPRLGFNLASP